ncbi:MAG: Asp-tRNA(Asn)/Glu-tRNA(Gln) amidotransferase subunit GatC [Anaerolineales bacterium]
MRLSIQEVEHIAALARLALTEVEKRLYAEQLSDILAYAARLEELDTEQISPTASVLDTQMRLREDQSRPGLSREKILKNAPETKQGQIKVPPVFGD